MRLIRPGVLRCHQKVDVLGQADPRRDCFPRLSHIRDDADRAAALPEFCQHGNHVGVRRESVLLPANRLPDRARGRLIHVRSAVAQYDLLIASEEGVSLSRRHGAQWRGGVLRRHEVVGLAVTLRNARGIEFESVLPGRG